MIPLINHDFQASGEQGSVVIKFTQILVGSYGTVYQRVTLQMLTITSKNAHLPTRGAQGTSIFSIPKGLADKIDPLEVTQWIGLRENGPGKPMETLDFPMKYGSIWDFSCSFSLEPIHWLTYAICPLHIAKPANKTYRKNETYGKMMVNSKNPIIMVNDVGKNYKKKSTIMANDGK